MPAILGGGVFGLGPVGGSGSFKDGGGAFLGRSFVVSTSAGSSFGSGLADAGCGSAGRTAVLTTGAAGVDGGFGVAAGGAIGVAAVLAALAAA